MDVKLQVAQLMLFPQFHALGVSACEAHKGIQSQQESPQKSEVPHTLKLFTLHELNIKGT